MNKTWRNQKINDNESEVLLKQSNVAELWWYIFQKVNKHSFHSAESKQYQLNPFDYILSIPDKSYLNSYSSSNAILSFLGKNNQVKLNDNDMEKVSTIYHELFHVFQTSENKKVLDYFYLVDDIQRKRVELLKYLGYCNFYPWAEEAQIDMGKTIFHSVEEYYKLTEELKNFDNLKQLYEQAQDIKKYSDLSRNHIESLIEFFKFSNDVQLHIFHLIEGSAQVFGWCCAGYNVSDKLSLRREELKKDSSQNSDMYEQAYELFINSGGNTPIVFIIISLLSLSMNNPIDTFVWSLTKVKNWEDELESLLQDKKLDDNIFKSSISVLIKQIETTLRGKFYTKDLLSIHDKKDDNSLFLKRLNRVRVAIPDSNRTEFFLDLVLNKNVALSLVNTFESHTKEYENELRKNEVMRDFEKFLRNIDNEEDFNLKCCSAPEHRNMRRYDIEDWTDCINKDSFNNILLSDFKVTIPSKLINN